MKDDVPTSKIKDMIHFSSKHTPKVNEYIKLTRASTYTVHGMKMNTFVEGTLSKDPNIQTFTQFNRTHATSTIQSIKQIEHSVGITISHPQNGSVEDVAPVKSRPWHKTFTVDLPYTTPTRFLENYSIDFHNHNRFTPSWSFFSTNKNNVPHSIMRIVLLTNNYLEMVYYYQFLLRKEYSYASDKFCTFILEKDRKTKYEFCIKESKNIQVKPSSLVALRIKVNNLEALKPSLNNSLHAVQHSNIEERTPLWQTMDPDGNNLIIEEHEPTLSHPFCFQHDSIKPRKSIEFQDEESPANLSFQTVDSGFSEQSLSTSNSPIGSVLKKDHKRSLGKKLARMASDMKESQTFGSTVYIPTKDVTGIKFHRITFV